MKKCVVFAMLSILSLFLTACAAGSGGTAAGNNVEESGKAVEKQLDDLMEDLSSVLDLEISIPAYSENNSGEDSSPDVRGSLTDTDVSDKAQEAVGMGGDFIYLENATFDSDLDALKRSIGKDYDQVEDSGTETKTYVFNNLRLGGHEAIVSAICTDEEITFIGTVLHVEEYPAGFFEDTSMADAYDKAIEYGDGIYGQRSEVLYDTVEGMEEYIGNAESHSGMKRMLAGGINSLVANQRRTYSYADESYSFLTASKAWFVDDEFVACVMYSGKNDGDREIWIYCFKPSTFMQSTSNILPAPESFETKTYYLARYGLPMGVRLSSTKDEITKLFDTQEMNGVVYFTVGDMDYAAEFHEDKLSRFMVFAASDDYEAVRDSLMEDYGLPTGLEFDEASLSLNHYNKGEAWSLGETMLSCIQVEGTGEVVVMYAIVDNLG